MKYSSADDIKATMQKIEEVEKRLDDIIVQHNSYLEELRKEVNKGISNLREEIVSMGEKLDTERKVAKKRKANIITIFKSE